jgi:outer membrane protein assembly factor BamA
LRFLLLFCLCCITLLPAGAAAQASTDTCSIVAEIIVSGKRKTRDDVILREINIQQFDCIAAKALGSELEIARLRLLNLRLFNEVLVSWEAAGNDSLRLLIQVTDRFPVIPEAEFEFADRNFNVWWTEQNRDLRRLNLGLTLNHTNFRGNREQVGLTAEAGYTQKAGLSYSRPFIDKNKKHGIGASVFGLQNKEIWYKTDSNKLRFYRSDHIFMQRRFELSAWYTYRPAYASTHRLQLTFQHFWISDTIAQLNADYLGEGRLQQDVVHLSYRFEYNGVDNWNYPLKGKRFIGVFDQRFALSGQYWQSSLHLHYDHYISPWNKWYASMTLRGRGSVPQQQPYIFRQNLGYEYDYVRGYEYYVVDGSCFGIARFNLKRELLNVQIRLPIRYFELIPIRIYSKVYADAGAGYNKYPINDRLYNRALYSAGFGIDIITLYDLKLRVEYTINHLGEKGLYLHRNGE